MGIIGLNTSEDRCRWPNNILNTSSTDCPLCADVIQGPARYQIVLMIVALLDQGPAVVAWLAAMSTYKQQA
jgi:hypothetical protein